MCFVLKKTIIAHAKNCFFVTNLMFFFIFLQGWTQWTCACGDSLLVSEGRSYFTSSTPRESSDCDSCDDHHCIWNCGRVTNAVDL